MLLALPLLFPGGLLALETTSPTDAQEAHARDHELDDDARGLISALRSQRDPRAPSPAELAEALPEADGSLIALAFRLLCERRIPPLHDDEAPQTLSELQQELLLEVFRHGGRARLLDRIGSTASRVQGQEERRAAVLALGATGTGDDVHVLFALALRGDEEAPPRRVSEALTPAFVDLLTREPDAHDDLRRLWRDQHDELRIQALRAIGRVGSSDGLGLLLEVLREHDDHQQLALSQLATLGPARDADLNDDLGLQVLRVLERSEPKLARAAAIAIGALEDTRGVVRLIDLLDSDDPGLRANAHWGLRRATGLEIPDNQAQWRIWLEQEQLWFARNHRRELRRLESQDEIEVLEALHALSQRRLHRWEIALDIEPLAFQHHAPLVRAAAIDALVELGCPGLEAWFEHALADPNDTVHRAARRALGAYGALAAEDADSPSR